MSAVERLAEQWNSTPDYLASDYDRGRVDQRHMMTTQLLEAIEKDRAGVVAEEPEWEYGVRHVDVSGWPRVQEHGSREDAEKDYATCGMNCGVVRRRDGGPWVPVKQEGAIDADPR